MTQLTAYPPPQPVPYDLRCDPVLESALGDYNPPGTRWFHLSDSSHTVISNREVIVKSYNYPLDKLIVENEMNNLMGIGSTIRTLDNGEKMIIMDYCGEPITEITLSGLVRAGNLLRIIHNTQQPHTYNLVHVDPYGQVENLVMKLLSDPDPEHTGVPEWIARECCKYQDLISTIPTCDDRLIHGDAHLFNLVVNQWGHLHYVDFERAALGHPVLDYGAVFQSLLIDQEHWCINPKEALPLLGFDHGSTDELKGGIIYNMVFTLDHHYRRHGEKVFQRVMMPKYQRAVKMLENL